MGAVAIGVATHGISAAYVPADPGSATDVRVLLKIGDAVSLPRRTWRRDIPGGAWTRCSCVEELDPVDRATTSYATCGRRDGPYGPDSRQARTGDIQHRRGEHASRAVRTARSPPSWACQRSTPLPRPTPPALPVPSAGAVRRLPAPRLASTAVKQCHAAAKRRVFCGDIGCYTLGNAAAARHGGHLPVHGRRHHHRPGRPRTWSRTPRTSRSWGTPPSSPTGIPGVVNAVYNQADMTSSCLTTPPPP